MNKKAIELSVNFIVMLVISIVVFSFGIYLMGRFFDYGNEVIFEWDEKHETALEDMMDRGEQVAIPFDHKKIGNKEYDKFAIGIFNTLGYEEDFITTIQFTEAYDRACTDIKSNLPGLNCDPDSWLKAATGSVPPSGGIEITKKIKNYEKAKFLVGVEPSKAPEGTYLFSVDVTYNGDLYDDVTHIIIVDVVY